MTSAPLPTATNVTKIWSKNTKNDVKKFAVPPFKQTRFFPKKTPKMTIKNSRSPLLHRPDFSTKNAENDVKIFELFDKTKPSLFLEKIVKNIPYF